MGSKLRAVYLVIKALMGVSTIIGVGFGTWAVVSAISYHMPLHEVFFWGFSVTAAAAGAVYLFLKVIDWLFEQAPEVSGRRRLATFLEEMRRHGNHRIRLARIVTLWTGDIPAARETELDRIVWNNRLRHLKYAVRQRQLAAEFVDEPSVSADTEVEMADAIDYFRSWRWLKVKDGEGP